MASISLNIYDIKKLEQVTKIALEKERKAKKQAEQFKNMNKEDGNGTSKTLKDVDLLSGKKPSTQTSADVFKKLHVNHSSTDSISDEKVYKDVSKMPSVGKKDLSLAKSVGELNDRAQLQDKIKRDANIKTWLNSADKVFKKAEHNDVMGDEENAYLFYMRFFNIMQEVTKTTKYQQDKKFYGSLVGKKTMVKAIERAEKLSESLRERYKKLEQETKKALEKERKAKEQAEQSKNDMNKQDVNGTSKTLKDIDDLLSGKKPSTQTSADVFKKLHVNHSSILSPSDSISHKDPFVQPNPAKINHSPVIDPMGLYQLLNDVNAANEVLLLDTRSKKDFESTRIDFQCCINIPEDLLRTSVSVGSIERKLPKTTRDQWIERGQKKYLVILDQNSKFSDVTPDSKVQCLKDAIYLYDSSCSLKSELLLLDGGFEAWVLHYPTFVTNTRLPELQNMLLSNQKPTFNLDPLSYCASPTSLEVTPANPSPAPMIPSFHPFNQSNSMTNRTNISSPVPETDTGISGLAPIISSGNPVFPNQNSHAFPTSHMRPLGPPTSHQCTTSYPSSHPLPAGPLSSQFCSGLQQSLDDVGNMSTPNALAQPQIPNKALANPIVKPSVPTQSFGSNDICSQGYMVVTSGRVDHRIPADHPKIAPLYAQSVKTRHHNNGGTFLPSHSFNQSHSTNNRTNVGPAPNVPSGNHVFRKQHSQIPSKPVPAPDASVSEALHSVPSTITQVPGMTSSGSHLSVTSHGQVIGQRLNYSQQPLPAGASTASSNDATPVVATHFNLGQQSSLNHHGGNMQIRNALGQPQIPNKALANLPNTATTPKNKSESPVVKPSLSIQSSGSDNIPSQDHMVMTPGCVDHCIPAVSMTTPTLPAQINSNSAISQHTKQQEQSTSVPRVPVSHSPGQPIPTSQPSPAGHSSSAGKAPPLIPPSCVSIVPSLTTPVSPAIHNPSTTVPGKPISSTAGSQSQSPFPSVPQNFTGSRTGMTRGLPPGWERVLDRGTGRYYFKDHNTKTTHWYPPASLAQTINQSIMGQGGSTLTTKEPEVKKASLKRSLSSPNLAKLDKAEAKENASNERPNRPMINRRTKPLSESQLANLAPGHGGLGKALTGLRNLGNTCYMNSVLQCLISTAPLVKYILNSYYVEDINKTNPLGTGGRIAEELAILTRVSHSGNYRHISPVEFKRTIGRFAPHFGGHEQQDSQEFLLFLLDQFHEDTNGVLEKPYIEEKSNDGLPDSAAARLAWENHKGRNESIIVELFQGQFKSTLTCAACSKISVKFDAFTSLTLPIPSNGSCQMEDCIRLFTTKEKVSRDNKWKCPRCEQHREAWKTMEIWKLPPILIVHFNRFKRDYDGSFLEKRQNNIHFPVTNFDMSKFVLGPKKSVCYNLYGVSNHYGSMQSGHYTAYCKNIYDKKWHKFDDSDVTQMSESSAKSSAAYILFYTSVEFLKP